MNEKEITIKVPAGKSAEWINGVLTLVDEPKKDDRPVTERIKTFEDALDELEVRAANGDNTAKMLYDDWYNVTTDSDDLIAFLKLRIICAVLNEGWEPQFTEGESRWYPWFFLYTDEELSCKSEEWKTSQALKMLRPHHTSYYCGIAYAGPASSASDIHTRIGSRICLKDEAIAEYCGKQFIDIWEDLIL